MDLENIGHVKIIYILNHIIRNRQQNNESTFAAFVDFEKAFDWVNHKLLYKLLLNNVDGKMYKAIKTLSTNTSSAIKLNMYQTEWFKCISGVRQGNILSTTLFSVFINDLAHGIKSMNIGINSDNIQVAILLSCMQII